MDSDMDASYCYDDELSLSGVSSINNDTSMELYNENDQRLSSEEKNYANFKLRNRLYHIKKQINYLSRLKRVLYQKLNEVNDTKLCDSFLEIPDVDDKAIGVDQVIGEVLSNNTTPKIVPVPPSKKKKAEPKKKGPAPKAVTSIVPIDGDNYPVTSTPNAKKSKAKSASKQKKDGRVGKFATNAELKHEDLD
uniref:Ino80 complex subunit e n=1 Tax=Rhabditophanes sp. KR3021 TaxID=114890 RepID=A0AC35U9R6_9BILA